MDMVQVTSSTIARIGYDAESLLLRIEFLNGTTYEYFDIPATVHAELMGSPSIGKYFNTAIRGHYRYARS